MENVPKFHFRIPTEDELKMGIDMAIVIQQTTEKI